MNSRHPHILNAASNLLGICFVIITGLKLTGSNPLSWADEVAWVAAVCFVASIALAYLGVRFEDRIAWQAQWAERSFIGGVGALFVSVLILATYI